jgi:hypothetical protein
VKEPRRLATETDTSELARSLLAAGHARREPHGARERVWKALAVGLVGTASTAAGGATVSGAGTTGMSTGGAAASAGTGTAGGASVKGAGIAIALTKAKLLALAGVVAVVSVTVVALERNKSPNASDVAPAAPASAPLQVQREAIESQPQVTEAFPPPSETHVNEPVAASATPIASVLPRHVKATPFKEETMAPVSQLREEAARLNEIRAALARGDLGVARSTLEEARTKFPNSQLAPERDALEVRLASDSGDHTRAARLAREFIERYPESPLRAGIESMTGSTDKR